MAGASTFSDPETGDLIVDDGVEAAPQPLTGQHFENLVGSLPSHVVDSLSSSLTEGVAWDKEGRAAWEEMLGDNLKLLGLGPESEPDDSEYDNSDTSDHPLMLLALLRFQSKALSALLPSPDRVCRTECALDLEAIRDERERDTMQEQADAAGRRVEKFFADYLLKRHKTYTADTDQILYESGFHGAGIRKVYTDHSRKTMKVRAEQVDIDRLIFSYDAKSPTSGRVSEIIDMATPELIRHIRNGTYRPIEMAASSGTEEPGAKERAENAIQALSSTLMRQGESHRIYEICADLFLSDDPHPDGLARPYIVTIHAASQEILSLRRNWQEGDPDETPIERYVIYLFHPGKNAVNGIGLGHILANITRALRKAQRRGLEAGYLQNHPSGFKMSSLKIRNDSQKVRPGEFIDVDTPSGDIRGAIMMHSFLGPSPGLIQLSDKMEQNGRELGGVATLDFAQLMKANVSPGPALAAYDESTEFQTAIHARLYRAHAAELRLIMDRMREVYGNKPVPFGINSTLHAGDLTMVDVIPVMRPGQVSRQRQILEARALVEAANEAPDVVNKRKAMEEYVRALGKSDISLYLLPDPEEEPPLPADPITEYQMALTNQPLKAGPSQNHRAHIDAHAAQMRMLQNSALPVGQGDTVMAVLAAHIAEHMGLELLVSVADKIGMPPDQLQQIPPEMEGEIAAAIAAGVQQIEAERQPPDQAGERLEVEALKGQNQKDLQELKARHTRELEQLKQQHAKDLQRQKDEAEMERSIQDDETALEIAAMADRNKAPAKAGGLSS